jgi:hypothetical protein
MRHLVVGLLVLLLLGCSAAIMGVIDGGATGDIVTLDLKSGAAPFASDGPAPATDSVSANRSPPLIVSPSLPENLATGLPDSWW